MQPLKLEQNQESSVITRFTDADAEIIRTLSQRFIAFDVETTGLNTHTERIVEIGAVLFEHCVPTARFCTLVNPGVRMPPLATSICGITDDMLADAPAEAEVYPALMAFLGDAADCQTFLCAHNARFDLDMLRHTLVRLGFRADIRYVDTLKLSRLCLPGMPNYKQPTLAAALHLSSGTAHRAADDALVCGRLLVHMLPKLAQMQ